MSTIFLSYAKEDKPKIDDIYKAFKQAKLNPWMDDPPAPHEPEGIPPGQDWDQFIRTKLKESRVTLAFLSNRSIAKQGYIQREYRLAIDVMMEKPLSEVYLIPVLLEDCTLPDIKVDTMSLHKLNWYKLYEKGLTYLTEYLSQITQSGSAKDTENENSQNLEIIALKNRIGQLEYMIEAHVKKTDELTDKLRWRLENEIRSWRDTYKNVVNSFFQEH